MLRRGLLMTSFVLCAFSIVGAQERPSQEYRVTDVQGPAGIVPKQTREPSPAIKGLLLLPGDRLITGKGGRVEVATKQGTVMELKEESNLRVDAMSENGGAFFLKIGRLLGRFASKKDTGKNMSYRIRTPMAVAAVRGTELGIVVDENKEMQAGVVEGEVAFGPDVEPSTSDVKTDEATPVQVSSASVEGSSATIVMDRADDDVSASSAPQSGEIVVHGSQGVVYKPGVSPVKMAQIPPLVVSSLDWFQSVRARVPALREQWKELDTPSQMKLRAGALREKITWTVPAKLGDDIISPSKSMEKKRIQPEKIQIEKPRVPKPQ